jgi:hypothetical protein
MDLSRRAILPHGSMSPSRTESHGWPGSAARSPRCSQRSAWRSSAGAAFSRVCLPQCAEWRRQAESLPWGRAETPIGRRRNHPARAPRSIRARSAEHSCAGSPHRDPCGAGFDVPRRDPTPNPRRPTTARGPTPTTPPRDSGARNARGRRRDRTVESLLRGAGRCLERHSMSDASAPSAKCASMKSARPSRVSSSVAASAPNSERITCAFSSKPCG